MRNAAMVNGRITTEQLEWLEQRADELDGNLSAALRQTITDARFLEIARRDYNLLCTDHPDFEFPPHDHPPHGSRVLGMILGFSGMSETEDLELRELEARGE
jgi:hypothetical protein